MPADECAVDVSTVAVDVGLSPLFVRFARFPLPDLYLTEMDGTASPRSHTESLHNRHSRRDTEMLAHADER